MDLNEIEWSDMDWIYLAKGRRQVAGSPEPYSQTSGSINYKEILDDLRVLRLLEEGFTSTVSSTLSLSTLSTSSAAFH
jgi:hypothetical protein